MASDLYRRIERMSPTDLMLFKRQLANLPENEKQKLFPQLSGISQLSDVISGTYTPPTARRASDVSFWQQALNTVTAPFDWIGENITEPFAAAVSSPFTPHVEGLDTEGMSWFERERAEYEAWEGPDVMPGPWTFRPVKGTLEFLPWLAVPTAGGIAAKTGALAKTAGTASSLGRSAGMISKAFKPLAAIESAPLKALGAVGKGILPKTAAKGLSKEVWETMNFASRSQLAKAAGLRGTVGQKTWEKLLPEEINSMLSAGRKVTTEAAERFVASVDKNMVSSVFPEGMPIPIAKAVRKLENLVRVAKPARAETKELYAAARGKQISGYTTAYEKAIKEGMGVDEAIAAARKTLAVPEGLPTAEMKGFESIREQIDPTDVKSLFDAGHQALAGSRDWDLVNFHEAMVRMLDPAVSGMPRDFEMNLLEEIFGAGLIKAYRSHRSLGQKVVEGLMDAANAPRALLASCDLSGLLRQGGVLTARHPIKGLQSVRPMVRAMLSDHNADNLMREILLRDGMQELLNPRLGTKLYLSPVPGRIGVALNEYEEAFMSRIANNFGPIRASNRAYSAGLNDLRSRSALGVLTKWKEQGVKYTKADVSDLNQLINWSSGRGTLPKALAHSGTALNTFFFSPRLMLSRFQLAGAGARAAIDYPAALLGLGTRYSPHVRAEILKTIGSFVGAGSSVLGMAVLTGVADVELDPRSSEFGKLHVKDTNTRLDIWTGYAQYLRFAAQIFTGERVTETGRVTPLNRMDIVDRMVQTKLSPAFGLFNDVLRGYTYMGEEMPPKSAKGIWGQLYNRMAPLAIQGIVDAYLQDGPLGALVGSSELIGVGSITYTDEVRLTRDKVARAQYGLTWDELGQKFGQAAQLRLEQTSEELKAATEDYENRFVSETPSLMQRWRSDGDSIEETYRGTIEQSVNEYRNTGDGVTFREKISSAMETRRQMYAARSKREEYASIMDYYTQPLNTETLARMNQNDIARRDYYNMMYGLDMFDEYGNYLFDAAEQKERQFVIKYGQAALDYIEEYQGSRWLDKPQELKDLERAKETLRPYWEIADKIWAMYPDGLRALSDQITLMERENPKMAERMLKRYPQIVRARELIVKYRKQLRMSNAAIQSAYSRYYKY